MRPPRLLLAAALLCAGAAPVARAIDIQFDFTFDSSNFFNGNLQRQNVLNAAALVFESRITDTLSAITPGGGNTWTASFPNPATGLSQNVLNRTIASNAVIVYVGARDLPGDTLGIGGPGGFSASGSAAFLDAVSLRGQTGASGGSPTDFGPWGGSVTFDSLEPWYFDQDVTTVESFGTSPDFYSVAVHELAHLLGFGTAPSWKRFVSGSSFTGAKSMTLNGGVPVPLDGDVVNGFPHWADGTKDDVFSPDIRLNQEVAMDPSIFDGTRKYFTELDYAGLDDIGWTLTAIPEPATATLSITGLSFALTRRRRPKAA